MFGIGKMLQFVRRGMRKGVLDSRIEGAFPAGLHLRTMSLDSAAAEQFAKKLFEFYKSRLSRLGPGVHEAEATSCHSAMHFRLFAGRNIASYVSTVRSVRSRGYPVVHSLSVTLSNHTILSTPPYNYPCPKDHLLILGVMPMGWSTWPRTLVL
jgi:hypothetical protein